MRNFHLPGRSPVYASNGMVATSHPLACSSALQVLKEGGNAVDAAVAAAAVAGVVEPQMTGIGGDCFCIVAEPDGTLYGLNGSGQAAMAADAETFQAQGITSIGDHPAHSVTVPGAVRAWETLLGRFGTLGFDRLLADAIGYARDGYVVAPRVAFDWEMYVDTLRGDAGAEQHMLAHGEAPVAGTLWRQPALASTLEKIAREGAAAFYHGEVAADIARTVQAAGGLLTEDDLAACPVDWVTPISVDYHGHEVFELPPNGQGVTALVMFALLEKLGERECPVDSTQRVHMQMEAARLAYSVRDAYVSDPATMTTRVEDILAPAHIASLAAMFDPQQRNPQIVLPQVPDADTVYLSVVDREGRAVSFINSIYQAFGSGIVTPDTGIVLQNRGACFVTEPGHPNAIGPGKRPLHTIIPPMVKKDGKVTHCFGVMGGAYQPVGHAHVLANMLDYGMDPQEALDFHRVFWNAEGVLELEDGAPAGMAAMLSTLGHRVRRAPSPHGGGQVIQLDQARGVLIGGSDPRKDGQAQGY